MQKITQKTRSIVNSNLHNICAIYHKQIPLETIFSILKSNGLIAIQEDKTEWQGFLCGADGTANINLKCRNCGLEISNSMLVLQWYKLQSGNFEVNAYIS